MGVTVQLIFAEILLKSHACYILVDSKCWKRPSFPPPLNLTQYL